MIKRKIFTITLLVGVLVMNTGILCQSLCLTGHDDMVKRETKGDVCPITHTSHNASPEALIKCDCSSHFEASLDSEITLTSTADLTLYLQNISKIQPYKIVFINTELIPLEDPPEILV